MSVTYKVIAHLGANEKLALEYVANYGTGQYQYGNLANDTITTDSFQVTVTYSVNNPKMKGQAGYISAVVLSSNNSLYYATGYIKVVNAQYNGGYSPSTPITYSYNSPQTYIYNNPVLGKGYTYAIVNW